MLKKPNPQWFKFFKKTAAVLFIAEGLTFAGSYYFWYKLNTNRGERLFHLGFHELANGRKNCNCNDLLTFWSFLHRFPPVLSRELSVCP